jgi:hypothetical protein
MSKSSGGIFTALIVVVLALLVGGIVFLSGMTWSRTDGGHYMVIRNGGSFDNNKIRDVLQPGSSRKWEGMFSQEHKYPASQRYYTIAGDEGAGDRPGVDVFQGYTADGVPVGIEGSVQFTLDGDPAILRSFDNKFGTRTFPVVGSNSSKHVWDGDTGWETFLDAVFRRQVLDNALRVEVQQYQCIELIPACKYVNAPANTNTNNPQPKKVIGGQQANQNLAQIQNSIAAELQSDFDSTLGGHYVKIDGFRISRVTLPGRVNAKIVLANEAKVDVQRQSYLAQQKVQRAIGDKEAKQQEAKGLLALNRAYAKSTAKARIDAIQAFASNLPRTLTTLIMGGQQSSLLNLNGK